MHRKTLPHAHGNTARRLIAQRGLPGNLPPPGTHRECPPKPSQDGEQSGDHTEGQNRDGNKKQSGEDQKGQRRDNYQQDNRHSKGEARVDEGEGQRQDQAREEDQEEGQSQRQQERQSKNQTWTANQASKLYHHHASSSS